MVRAASPASVLVSLFLVVSVCASGVLAQGGFFQHIFGQHGGPGPAAEKEPTTAGDPSWFRERVDAGMSHCYLLPVPRDEDPACDCSNALHRCPDPRRKKLKNNDRVHVTPNPNASSDMLVFSLSSPLGLVCTISSSAGRPTDAITSEMYFVPVP